MFEMNFSDFGVERTINYYRDVGIPENFYPDKPFILRALLYRLKLNMNTFILIVGNPRSGKSVDAIKIAEEFCGLSGQVFCVEEQLTFDDVRKFLMWSINARESIFILDETGTSLAPDQFWSLQQRIMRRFCQVGGFRKNVLIWVLPSIAFIQKGFRFLANYAMLTKRQGMVDVYKVVVNQLIGKGFPDKIETMKVAMPSEETWKKYTGMKDTWNDVDLKKEIASIDKELHPPLRIRVEMDKKTGNINYYRQNETLDIY